MMTCTQTRYFIHAKMSRCAKMLLVLLAACSPAIAQEGDAAMQTFYAANGLLNRGHDELAIAEYQRFLQQHADHEKAKDARYGLSVAYYRSNDYDNAIKQLQQIHGQSGYAFSAEVACMLAKALSSTGKKNDAISAFAYVLKNHPDHDLADDAAAGLIEASFIVGMHAQAAEQVKEFAGKWPHSPLRSRAEFFGARSSMKLGDFATAAMGFSTVLEKSGKDAFSDQARLLEARCYHLDGKHDQAIETYRKAIASSSDGVKPDLMLGLVTLLRKQEQFAEGVNVARALLQRFPESPLAARTRFELGHMLYAQAEFSGARDAFDAAATGKHDFVDDAVYWSARCSAMLGDHETAARMLADAESAHSDSDLRPQMMYDQAIALTKKGDFESAKSKLHGLLNSFPDHHLAEHALYVLATQSHAQRDYESSQTYCEDFLKKHEDSAYGSTIIFMMGENLFLLNRYAAAASRYEEFLNKYPNDGQATRALYRRGMALFSAKQSEQALPVLSKIVTGPKEKLFAGAWLATGDIYFQRSEWKNAARFLAEYLAMAPSESVDDALLKLGLSLQRLGRSKDALNQFDAIINDHAESRHLVQAWFERGQVLAELGRTEQANRAFQEVVNKEPDGKFASHALSHLGSGAMLTAQSSDAADYFAKASKTTQDESLRSRMTFQQGQALFASGEYDKASNILNSWLSKNQSDSNAPVACAQLVIALARQRNCESANESAQLLERKYRDATPGNLLAAARYENAWCLQEVGRTSDSAKVYRSILQGDSPDEIGMAAAIELSAIEEENKACDKVIELLHPIANKLDDKSVATDEQKEQVWYRLGICQFREEAFKSAEAALKNVDGVTGNRRVHASALFFRGESLMQLKRQSDAANCFQQVASEFAEDALCEPALLRLGEALANLQRWSTSEQAYTEHRTKFPNSQMWFQAQFGLAWAMEHQGRHADAIRSYRAIVEKHTGASAARAQFQIGECLFATKQYEEAARELLKVDILFAYPQWSAAALYEAGRCFEAQGKRVDARKQYQRVVDDFSESEWAKLAAKRLEARPDVSIPGRTTRRTSD